MKTETMRLIDRIIGTPLCNTIAGLAPLLTRSSSSETVVVCKFFGIGSICLSYPLLYELRQHGKVIVYLTFRANEPVVRAMGIGQCISIDPSSFSGFIRDVLLAVRAVRKHRPGAFLNLEFFSRFAAIFSVLSGAGCRAGFHMLHLPVGKMYTHRTNLNVYRNIADNYLNIGTIAGQVTVAGSLPDYVETFPYRPPKPAIAGSDKAYFVLNAESSETIRTLRSWPMESWIELIGRLRTTYPDHRIFVIGTVQGQQSCQQITRPFDLDQAVTNCAGQTGFEEFAGLIAHADLVISVDSAPLHLSAFLRRKTIGMFGPETPVLYGYDLPWVRTLYRNLMCSPCLAVYDAKKSVLDCRDNQCMKQISVADVMAEAGQLLGGA